MKITRLRLLGFKSFVEPTELLVEPGLTGVVGPNGCGKSNLLEALRWVMGETSYKSMRGAAMEDVIFAGSEDRPGRNSAEVTLFLDNSARTAPAEFNDSDALEVTRRIEREAGSAYKVNGKDARARDVRLLFEDAATGARSPALVRQGRIGEIVNAPPQERRRVLEDAAGIAGLHSRRHEAELRLAATEANLARLSDLIGQLASQLQALRRQARQAQRYREISGKIREAEALQHHLHWVGACAHVEQEEASFQQALTVVAQETKAEGEALRQQAEAAEKLQPLRDEEAARAAVLHRLSVERDALEREEARAMARQAELETRLAQASRDLAREEEHIAEAEGILRRLGEEKRRLEAASSRDHEEPQLRAAAAKAKSILDAAERTLRDATTALAEARAERGKFEGESAELQGRMAKLEAQSGALEAELAQREAESGNDAKLQTLNAGLAELSAAVQRLEIELQAAEGEEEAARETEAKARATASAAKLASQELETELATLVKLLAPAHDWSPIVDEIKVTSGYEQALGAALGDDLDAASNEKAPSHWRLTAASGEDPELPEGAIPLSKFVKGPEVLSRRLRQIGVVEAGSGRRLQARLAPGQRLVSKDGDLWRWDGYSIKAGSDSAAGARLMERRRLKGLKAEVAKAQARAAKTETEFEAAAQRAEASQMATKALRQEAKEAHAELDRTRDAIAAAEHEAQASSKTLGALAEALAQSRTAFDEAQAHGARVAAALVERAALSGLEAALEAAQGKAAQSRQAAARADAALEGFERELHLRQERMEAIDEEEELWRKRIANAREQILTLRAREEETSADLAALANLPAEIEQRRMKLFDAIAAAERCEGQGRRRTCPRRDRSQGAREGFARGAGAAGGSAGNARAERGAARSGARAPQRDGARHPRTARLHAGGLPRARRA